MSVPRKLSIVLYSLPRYKPWMPFTCNCFKDSRVVGGPKKRRKVGASLCPVVKTSSSDAGVLSSIPPPGNWGPYAYSVAKN